jgi:hypothetical protein
MGCLVQEPTQFHNGVQKLSNAANAARSFGSSLLIAANSVAADKTAYRLPTPAQNHWPW